MGQRKADQLLDSSKRLRAGLTQDFPEVEVRRLITKKRRELRNLEKLLAQFAKPDAPPKGQRKTHKH